MILSFRPFHTKISHGFTLTELAIVLGVAGILLAGVMAMVGGTNENARVEQSAEQMAIVVNKVRAYYQGQMSIPSADLTSQMITLNIIPTEMVTNRTAPSADNLWDTLGQGGTFRVLGIRVGVGGAPRFWVNYMAVTQQGCYKFIMKMQSPSAPSGLAYVKVNAWIFPLPIMTYQLAQSCFADVAGVGVNALSFRYNLRQ